MKQRKRQRGSGSASWITADGMSPLVAHWCLRLLLARRGRLQQLLSEKTVIIRAFASEIGAPL